MKKPRRTRLLKGGALLLLDEKLVNLLRIYQLFADELAKPQKSMVHLSSMMGELGEISEMIAERLQWLFNHQYPREHFIWGAIKSMKSLPDEMPESEQPAARRYKERNGL